ncbi:MAG: hypothetical protein AAF721_22805 [Myxococcota bacterium]
MKNLWVVVAVSLAAPACAVEVEGFARTATRIGCKYQRDCDPDAWDRAGFDSVLACVDERFTPEDDNLEGFCIDYDAAAARRCLRLLRENRRECGDEYEQSQQTAHVCNDVCSSTMYLSPGGPVFPLAN